MMKHRIFPILLITALLAYSIPSYGETVKDEEKKFYIRYSPLIFEDVTFVINPSYEADKKDEKDGIGKLGDGITKQTISGLTQWLRTGTFQLV